MDRLDPRAIIARSAMHPRQIAVIALATLLNALDGFDVLAISFASPDIAKEWGVDRAALGLVLSMELIGMAVGAVVLGSFADRAGRRPSILICLFIMAIGMALAALSRNVTTLLIIRLFTGIGIGGMLAATNAVVAEFSNARNRSLAISIMVGGYPLGAVLGGSFAAALLAWTGQWQAIFISGAIAATLLIPLTLLLLPETISYLCSRQTDNALKRVNKILKTFGHSPVTEIPKQEAVESKIGVASLFGKDFILLTCLLICMYFFHIMAFYFFMKWTPKLVADIGYSSSSASVVLVWANVGGAVGCATMSLLTRQLGVEKLVVAALIGGAIAIALFGQGLTSLSSLSFVAATVGFCTNSATAGLYAVFAQSFPARLRASGTGLIIGIGRGGAALGPILAGLLFSAGWPLSQVAPLMACGCLISAIALLYAGRLATPAH